MTRQFRRRLRVLRFGDPEGLTCTVQDKASGSWKYRRWGMRPIPGPQAGGQTFASIPTLNRIFALNWVPQFPFCNGYIVNRCNRLGVLLASENLLPGGTMSAPPSPTGYPSPGRWQPPPPQPPRKNWSARRKAWTAILGVVGVLVVLGVIGAVAGPSKSKPTANVGTIPAPTRTSSSPAPSPTPTPSP